MTLIQEHALAFRMWIQKPAASVAVLALVTLTTFWGASNAIALPRRVARLKLTRLCYQIDYPCSEVTGTMEEFNRWEKRHNREVVWRGEGTASKIDHLSQNTADITFLLHDIETDPAAASKNSRPPSRTILHYHDPQSAQPFVLGNKVSVGLDSAGNLVYALFRIDVRYWRKRPDGRFEIVAQLDSAHKGNGLIHIHPRYLGDIFPQSPTKRSREIHDPGMYQGYGVLWTKTHGIVVTTIDIGCGGGDYESETIGRNNSGVKVENEPNFRFRPGRDDWKSVEQGGVSKAEIPEEQYIEYDANPC